MDRLYGRHVKTTGVAGRRRLGHRPLAREQAVTALILFDSRGPRWFDEKWRGKQGTFLFFRQLKEK
jgi:hypothetical protein